MRVAPVIPLAEDLKHWLQKQVSSALTPQRLVERGQIVLLAAQGQENLAIAARLGCRRQKVARWRDRFQQLGRAGIESEAPGRGRQPVSGAERSQRIVERTLRSRPPLATHWSRRTLAKALDIGPTTVGKVWQAHGLKPPLARTFQVSHDPRFVEKLEEVVGLYRNAPEHAMVWCCDEQSQVQALARTQPGLPRKQGRAGTMTHDCVRHGTTTLFAALNVADGTLIGPCQDRPRHQEWLKFLQLIEAQTPAGRDLHLLLDNYATHKHPKVKKWLARHPRFHLHFTPTRASWLNLVERFFRDLTVHRLRRGVFRSLPELVEALPQYLASYHKEPKPDVWTAKARDLLAKVKRAREKLHRPDKAR